MDALYRYDFPGNVRDLENILERAITLCDGHEIHASNLQLNQYFTTAAHETAINVYSKPATTALSEAIPTQINPYLDNAEKQAIIKALEETRYNKTAAARLLGITFRALRYRLKKYGID